MVTNEMFEYVFVLYNNSRVTTVIGYADYDSTMRAFHQSCAEAGASWGHAFKGDGTPLGSYGVQA